MTGWRNSDWPWPDDDDRAPGAWLVGLAILAVLAITSFVLIGIGLIGHAF